LEDQLCPHGLTYSVYMLQGTAAVRIATAAGNPHLLSLAVLHCVAYIK